MEINAETPRTTTKIVELGNQLTQTLTFGPWFLALLHMLDVIHPSFSFEPGLVIVFDLVHTCKIDNTRKGMSKPKQLVAKISFASYKHE